MVGILLCKRSSTTVCFSASLSETWVLWQWHINCSRNVRWRWWNVIPPHLSKHPRAAVLPSRPITPAVQLLTGAHSKELITKTSQLNDRDSYTHVVHKVLMSIKLYRTRSSQLLLYCVHCECFNCFKLRLTTFIKRILIDWLRYWQYSIISIISITSRQYIIYCLGWLTDIYNTENTETIQYSLIYLL